MTAPQPLKTFDFNNSGGLLGVPGPFRHAWDHCVKLSLWETPYSPTNDHFCVPCWHPTCKFLLMKFSYLGSQAISRVDCWFVITAMYMKNRTMGIPTNSGGWTFWEFVDFRLFTYARLDKTGESNGGSGRGRGRRRVN